eukprot:SAG31_NODE_3885_length_3786_cov_2.016554_1_plen_60_part_00
MCTSYGVAFLAFVAGAAAQEITFAGFATKADCHTTPCGGYGKDCYFLDFIGLLLSRFSC